MIAEIVVEVLTSDVSDLQLFVNNIKFLSSMNLICMCNSKVY